MNASATTGLAQIERWFAAQGWQPFPFQYEAWQAYQNGESGLIHSSTGTGKTYAVWLGAVIEALADQSNSATNSGVAPPIRVLWITPLRALAADTMQSLQAPIDALGLPWTVETRTSDTSSSTRNRQRDRLPTALITTPESLSLLLTRPNARELFADLRLVVVDEWHELLGSKRGVQAELGLARLRQWIPGLRTWGLSATLGNLDNALQVLIGTQPTHSDVRLISGISKPVQVDSIIPAAIDRFPWAGHLGLTLLPQVIEAVESSHTSLIFTNTRNQTERWYQAILDARPEWASEIALHHGSLAAETRLWVENGLRAGTLRCVVCTSSLDLGVDFPAVERVLQIGSPKGAARLLQRAGRSGHQPGAVSRVTCVPTHNLELMEISAAREALADRQLEARVPVENALDVLIQHLVTVALGGGFTSESLYQEVRTAYAYRDLSREAWQWAIDFVTSGGAALHAYAQYSRVVLKDDRYTVEDKQIAQLHRMSIGTILGDSTLEVQYLRGGRVGAIEESFIARLQPGDVFTLGGKTLEYVSLRDMKVWVRKAGHKHGLVPVWYGGSLPLSEQLTAFVRARIEEAHDGTLNDAEMAALDPIWQLQARWSFLPTRDQLLIEQVKTREGYHVFAFPFEGQFVNEGLAVLIAYRLSRSQPLTVTITVNDYGFELLSPDPIPLTAENAPECFSLADLESDLLHSLNLAEMARRQFREIARTAGLVISRFPGGSKSVKQIQASSSLLYDVFAQYDPGNLLLDQARREVLQRQLDQTRLTHTLTRIAASEILLKDVPHPTPFAFPLLIDRVRQTVTTETLEARITKMQASYERWADQDLRKRRTSRT